MRRYYKRWKTKPKPHGKSKFNKWVRMQIRLGWATDDWIMDHQKEVLQRYWAGYSCVISHESWLKEQEEKRHV